ncbi:ASST-domain-containing protein [Aspergillus pseudonomiae]|uniref:ASST-domain-containing protein n=1 Tax=Aspergillus pseudonomiae TaxID=1506151 RepID=A0A5N7CVU8_9EURO|nr:ASST-domain-containing protein [Aspergillus pseudonomiae]KAB8256509.1 ASST-domain-containing protein [Aspergillus pseudonomiae]KAE8397738.1 ASST-domain-containing protein [Aspergillus pseudonomiae]
MKFSTALSFFISGAAIALALPSSGEIVEADCVKPYLCCGELKTPLDPIVDPILKQLGINAASIVGSIGLACKPLSATRVMPGMTLAKLGLSAALKPTSWVAQSLLGARTSSLRTRIMEIIEFANEITASGLIPSRVLAWLNGYATIDLDTIHRNNPSPENLSIYPYKAKSDAPYSVAENTLRAAIHIPKSFSLEQDKKLPVLLVPGTAVPAAINFYFNFGKLSKALPESDLVWVDLPQASLDDIQLNAEYVAYALNYVSALTSSNIAVISWSQGALDIQWALKYWPSTRNVVNDFIAISPDFHGTIVRWMACPLLSQLACTPSIWQQGWDANFIQVLRSNRGDSAYVPTTTIYSSFDTVVMPMSGENASARLLDHSGVGVSNNHLQTICANKAAGGLYTHEGVLYNPLAWALTVDALRHDGPGNITRIDIQKICEQLLPPFLDLMRALKFDITYYDRDATLIWAGSCLYDNRNIFDFKAVPNIDGGSHLSFILQHTFQFEGDEKGTAYVLDQHYETEKAIPVTNDLAAFNMHEFNVLDGGKTALACTYRSKYMNLGALGRPDEYSWVFTGGLVELDTATGEVLFEWDSEGYIPLDESVKLDPSTPVADPPGWDYIHVNAVDKNAAGDYILSARFTNTIYLISGKDKSIIWRLGGETSDFVQDFTFSKQHHVRFIESNATHTTISFLNNASDEIEQGEDTSSALYVQLHTSVSPMTAKVIARYNRPDGDLTRLRGNVQTLPNGNVFVGWSERGYQSEHSPEGNVLMEARFASSRFSTYRSYKFDFTGRPNTPPDVVSSVYGTDETDLTTIFHVSWNGATDVASWNFYARANQDGMPVLVGNTTKLDFETMYIADGYLDWVSVEAVDKDGNALGTSEIQRTEPPSNWRLAGFQGNTMPTPHDPSDLHEHKTIAVDDDADDADDAEEVYVKAQEAAESIYKAWEVIRGVGGLLIFVLVLCSTGGLLAGMYWYFRRRSMQAYHEVASEESQPLNERST